MPPKAPPEERTDAWDYPLPTGLGKRTCHAIQNLLILYLTYLVDNGGKADGTCETLLFYWVHYRMKIKQGPQVQNVCVSGLSQVVLFSSTRNKAILIRYLMHNCMRICWLKIPLFWLKLGWIFFTGFKLISCLHRLKQILGSKHATNYRVNQWWHTHMTTLALTGPGELKTRSM